MQPNDQLSVKTEHNPTNKRPVRAGEFIRSGSKPYGIVPFELLECRSLTPLARLVAVWIESKPDGWIVRPAVLQKALGITEKQWLSARRSMITIGIFTHQQYRKPDGKWSWKNEFDISPILSAIPPLAVHGKAANIDVRDIEVRDKGLQNTEASCANAHEAMHISQKSLPRAYKSDVDELKKLHLGFVLNELQIAWREEGDYIYWGDYCRARQHEDGHWLWLENDSSGEAETGGSAIDLIMTEGRYSQAQAINILRRVYREATKDKVCLANV